MKYDEGSDRREWLRASVEEKLRPVTVPNFITMVRMAMIPFFVLAVSERDFRLALLVFVLAGLTDAMDGFLARFLDMHSVIGAYLDPLADKLLLTTAYVSLTVPMGQRVVIPLWLTILALFRDLLIVFVAVSLYMVEDVRRFPPSVWGKATTFMHVLTVVVVLMANMNGIPGWLPGVCFYVSFGFVLISGFNYIYRASGLLEAARARRRRDSDSEADSP